MSHYFKRIYLLIALLSTLGFSPYALGAVPDGINFQAYLTNADGSVIDSDVSVSFVAYNVEVGGAPLWTQTETVTVDQGLFSLALGNPVNPFPANLFDGPVYIGLIVSGEELLPRRALTSSAYSFKASDADTLTGISASTLDQSAHVSNTANPHSVTVAQIGAAGSADIAALQTQLNAALGAIATLQNEVSNLQSAVTANDADILDVENDIVLNGFSIGVLTNVITTVQTDVTAIEGNSVLALDGYLAMNGQNARFTGVNLQVVSGSGATQGLRNGLGNILIGYNEAAVQGFFCSVGTYSNQVDCTGDGFVWSNNHKSGSHNLVVGAGHNYSSDSGTVSGDNNSVLGPATSVTGGKFNVARALGASVSGGTNNQASSINASVTGGQYNTASGINSTVTGGKYNTASGLYSTVSGGGGATVGSANIAGGDYSSVSGGIANETVGLGSSISGGGYNQTSNSYASVAGGRYNIAGGPYSTVSGGGGSTGTDGNVASGSYASISGGIRGQASGGGSSVSGGVSNFATATWSTVSGGANRQSTGEADWRAGTLFENF